MNVQAVSTDNHKQTGIYVTVEELIALKHSSRHFDLSAHRKALQTMIGSHLSSFRGRGIEFDEARVYQPGDDVRNIDWRVTARRGKAHTKLFREERERPVYLIVDQSQTLFFGSQVALKSVIAARTATHLAWGVTEHGDRVGGFIFSGQQHRELRPKPGKRGIQQLCRTLAEYNQALKADFTEVAHCAPINNAIKRLNAVIHPGSLVFVISDFHGYNRESLATLSTLTRHSDIVCIYTYDPLEKHLPRKGTFGFTNGHDRLFINTDLNKIQKAYQDHFQQHHEKLKEVLLKAKIPLIDIATTDNIPDTLHNALRDRNTTRERR